MEIAKHRAQFGLSYYKLGSSSKATRADLEFRPRKVVGRGGSQLVSMLDALISRKGKKSSRNILARTTIYDVDLHFFLSKDLKQ